MSNFKDLTGQRFGRLVALHRVPNHKTGNARWMCVCDCGNTTIANSSVLRSGAKKSCGCLVTEHFSKLGKSRKKGHRDSRLYSVWGAMKQRCLNPNHPHYKDYGGRGITICAEWESSYDAFYKWAISNGYDEIAPRGQCTIDRIDNDKGYSPDNCRWTTMLVQNNNHRKKQRRKSDTPRIL